MFANPFKLKKQGILGMNKRNIQYIGGENDRKYYPLVDNKLKTKVVAQDAGIAVPKLLATIERHSQLRKLKDILEGTEQLLSINPTYYFEAGIDDPPNRFKIDIWEGPSGINNSQFNNEYFH